MIDTPNGTPGTALATVPRQGLLRPIAPAVDILAAQNETRELIAKTLVEGRDFGAIPGTDKDRKTLLKPGAERVCNSFGCVPRLTLLQSEVDHDRAVPWQKTKWVTDPAGKPDNWQELKDVGEGRNRKFGEKWVWQRRVDERGTSLGFYRYLIKCELVHRESGQIVGEGLGSCSTLEAKYIDRPRDSENTVLKMAKKRAFIDATLTAFGLSDQFTQDVEDAQVEETSSGADSDGVSTDPADQADDQRVNASEPQPSCPKCGGLMWDNRKNKRNPKAPDYKCRAGSCEGVIWPGQWPVAPAASEAQREQIAALLPTAKLKQERSRAKIVEKLADTAKPLNAKEADELIQKLKGLQPTVSDKAADELKARQESQTAADPEFDPNTVQSTADELPF